MRSEPIKRTISSLTGFISVEKLISVNGHRLVLPFWHAVSDVPVPHLSHLYRVPSISEFERDLDFLMKKINPPIKTVAFPFTDFKVPNSVFEKANIDRLWDVSFGTAGIKDEAMPNHLQRIPMEPVVSKDGKQVIRTEYVWYYLKSIFEKK